MPPLCLIAHRPGVRFAYYLQEAAPNLVLSGRIMRRFNHSGSSRFRVHDLEFRGVGKSPAQGRRIRRQSASRIGARTAARRGRRHDARLGDVAGVARRRYRLVSHAGARNCAVRFQGLRDCSSGHCRQHPGRIRFRRQERRSHGDAEIAGTEIGPPDNLRNLGRKQLRGIGLLRDCAGHSLRYDPLLHRRTNAGPTTGQSDRGSEYRRRLLCVHRRPEWSFARPFGGKRKALRQEVGRRRRIRRARFFLLVGSKSARGFGLWLYPARKAQPLGRDNRHRTGIAARAAQPVAHLAPVLGYRHIRIRLRRRFFAQQHPVAGGAENHRRRRRAWRRQNGSAICDAGNRSQRYRLSP